MKLICNTQDHSLSSNISPHGLPQIIIFLVEFVFIFQNQHAYIFI